MKDSSNIRLRERGFTLVELMVAMTLSLFLLGAITYVVVNSNKNYNTTDSLSRLQENARFAMEFIERDLRRAGYLGCANDISAVNSTLSDSAYGNTNRIIRIDGVDDIKSGSTWASSGETVSFTNAPVTGASGTGSDAIAVRYLDRNNSIALTQNMLTETASLFINHDPNNNLKTGDIIAVANCDAADVMQITGITQAGSEDKLAHSPGKPKDANGDDIEPGNATQQLSQKYMTVESAAIFKFGSFAYYVGTNSNGRRALFRQTTGGTEELVEGVENMQILYGELSGLDLSTTTYQKASSVGNWGNVVSVRVGLLLGTVANTADGQYGVDTDSGTYSLNGTDVTPPAERRLRKRFVSTIMLRNMKCMFPQSC